MRALSALNSTSAKGRRDLRADILFLQCRKCSIITHGAMADKDQGLCIRDKCKHPIWARREDQGAQTCSRADLCVWVALQEQLSHAGCGALHGREFLQHICK